MFTKYQTRQCWVPTLNGQVKTLVINFAELDVYFQNFLQESGILDLLYVFNCIHQDIATVNQVPTMKFYIPLTGITTLEQHNCLAPSRCFLSPGTYNNLRNLVINKGGPVDTMDFGFLTKAPNLTSLTLKRVSFSSSVLEAIHSNLSSLETLKLNEMVIGDMMFSENSLTPAESLTKLLNIHACYQTPLTI